MKFIIPPPVILTWIKFSILDAVETGAWIQSKRDEDGRSLVDGNWLDVYDDTIHNSTEGDGHRANHLPYINLNTNAFLETQPVPNHITSWIDT